MKKDDIKIVFNEKSRNEKDKKFSLKDFSKEKTVSIRGFHKSFPQYNVTPLIDLRNLAENLKVKRVWVKDESKRFGLNAFKVLGGAYAAGKYISKVLDIDIDELPYEKMTSKEIKDKLGKITFTTATDGNHGRGVAWVARELGQKAVIYMPKGSTQARFNNIKSEGAEVTITELNYDDTVKMSNENAKKYGRVVIQDTAWEGYEEIPLWIMQGYSTIMDEILEELEIRGEELPTHIFLQAGVGSFPASMVGYLTSVLGEKRPISIIVEPHNAACIYKSALINDGKPHGVKGDLQSIMAGLSCGEPNILAYNILRDYADAYISCDDYVTARGMRILGNPLKDDIRIVSGESGAVGLGLLTVLMQKTEYKDISNKLNLNEDSRVLIISTEGDTDPVNYRKIVWDGLYNSL